MHLNVFLQQISDETMNQQIRTIELRDNNESRVYIWSAARIFGNVCGRSKRRSHTRVEMARRRKKEGFQLLSHPSLSRRISIKSSSRREICCLIVNYIICGKLGSCLPDFGWKSSVDSTLTDDITRLINLVLCVSRKIRVI